MAKNEEEYDVTYRKSMAFIRNIQIETAFLYPTESRFRIIWSGLGKCPPHLTHAILSGIRDSRCFVRPTGKGNELEIWWYMERFLDEDLSPDVYCNAYVLS